MGCISYVVIQRGVVKVGEGKGRVQSVEDEFSLCFEMVPTTCQGSFFVPALE